MKRIRLKSLVKEGALSANSLMSVDSDIWLKLNVEDGNALKKKWPTYLQMLKSKLTGNYPVSKAIISQLEAENHHSLIAALEQLHLTESKINEDHEKWPAHIQDVKLVNFLTWLKKRNRSLYHQVEKELKGEFHLS